MERGCDPVRLRAYGVCWTETHPVIVDVNKCLIGCIVWAVLLIVWIVVFQASWEKVPFFRSLQMMNPEGIAWQ